MKDIQTVIFDLDDTLLPEEPLKRRTFMDICARAAALYDLDTEALYDTFLETAREIWHQAPERVYCVSLGFSSWEGLLSRYTVDTPTMTMMREWARYYREESWRRTLKKCGVDDDNRIRQLVEITANNGYQHYELYDDAQLCLEELSVLFTLAMLTNGVPDIQYGKLDGTGITGYFSTILVSGEAGYGKPDIRLFIDILRLLGINPEQALMVGNSLKNDIAGAQTAGMKTAWVNRNGEIAGRGIIPDIEVTDLMQLVKVLKTG